MRCLDIAIRDMANIAAWRYIDIPFLSSFPILAHYMLRFRATPLLCMACKKSLFSARQFLPGPGISCLLNRQVLPLAWNVLCIFLRKVLKKPGRKVGMAFALL